MRCVPHNLALDENNLPAASKQIGVAKNLSDNSAAAKTELTILQKRLTDAQNEIAFAEQLVLGVQAKTRDEWKVAETHFKRARDLKPEHKTALENYDLARRVNNTEQQIRRHLDAPNRLGDAAILDAVITYLRDTENVIVASAKIKKDA